MIVGLVHVTMTSLGREMSSSAIYKRPPFLRKSLVASCRIAVMVTVTFILFVKVYDNWFYSGQAAVFNCLVTSKSVSGFIEHENVTENERTNFNRHDTKKLRFVYQLLTVLIGGRQFARVVSDFGPFRTTICRPTILVRKLYGHRTRNAWYL